MKVLRALRLHLSAASLAAATAASFAASLTPAPPRSNPLDIRTSSGQPVQSCADPTMIRGQTAGDTDWYMYCTSDPLGDWDQDGSGNYHHHQIPTFRSSDLVHWTYAGDAFSAPPSWAESWAGLWAPEIQYFDGKYHLYYAVTDTKQSVSGEWYCGEDSAIGVATSANPTGPWTDKGSPVVRPRRSGSGCSFYATIDPDVTTSPEGQRYIYYGSYDGGVEVRQLSSDGLSSSAASATRVAIGSRYEGTEVVQHGGFYYLFASATDCCRGPLTGYAVFVGRSASPTGPFVDREGVSFTAGRVGGTPVLSMSGNRWLGPGHNTVFTDLDGQDWTIFHAVDSDDPYFAGSVGFTKRPAQLDPLDWVDGWPTVRGGWGASSCGGQAAPAAQAGQTSGWTVTTPEPDLPGAPNAGASDEFDGAAPGPQWSWVRPPSSSSWGMTGAGLRFDTQPADLYGDQNNASVLIEPAPPGNWIVETRVKLNLPAEGCCHNYVQAGLVIYGDDDNYIKLVHVSMDDTRQTEFAKELAPVPSGYPRYGNTVVGPPDLWTWLRVARRGYGAGERYSASTSRDGATWVRGGTWTHSLGSPSIGLVSMGGSGYTAEFDYVRVFALPGPACVDPAHADPCDDDGDGTGEACDADDDNDGVADPVDCAPLDSAQGRPPDPAPLLLSGTSPTSLTWPVSLTADRWDVSRGLLSSLAPANYGGCFADDLSQPAATDTSLPPVGDGWYYLVRGEDAGCGGSGIWGTNSSGSERVNGNSSACP